MYQFLATLIMKAQPLLGNGSANGHKRNNSMATALQHWRGVFNAVRAEML
jgi:hypothetical protein